MSKVSIQNGQGETIVGILEKKELLDIGRPQPRVILITHGVLGSRLIVLHVQCY